MSGSYHQHLTFVQIDTSCKFYEKHVSKAHIFDNLMMFEIFELRHEKTCFLHLSLVLRKPVFRVSDQVSHKPGCTATEDG